MNTLKAWQEETAAAPPPGVRAIRYENDALFSLFFLSSSSSLSSSFFFFLAQQPSIPKRWSEQLICDAHSKNWPPQSMSSRALLFTLCWQLYATSVTSSTRQVRTGNQRVLSKKMAAVPSKVTKWLKDGVRKPYTHARTHARTNARTHARTHAHIFKRDGTSVGVKCILTAAQSFQSLSTIISVVARCFPVCLCVVTSARNCNCRMTWRCVDQKGGSSRIQYGGRGYTGQW